MAILVRGGIFQVRIHGENVECGVDVPQDDEQDEDVGDGANHGESRVIVWIIAESY